MSYRDDSYEARLGAQAETEAAEILQRRGAVVLPVYSCRDNTDSTKAPLILTPWSGSAVGPDILCFSGSSRTCWIDVKGKAVPTWRRALCRWEHGIDFAHFRDYESVGHLTGLDVWLLVRESKRPVNPGADLGLVDVLGGSWLAIKLTTARAMGEHRADWPGGKAHPDRRGKGGLGGFLWPRSAMTQWADSNREEKP